MAAEVGRHGRSRRAPAGSSASRPPAVRRGLFGPDPYAAFRAVGHVIASRGALQFPLVVDYDEVRRVAREWRTFTSDTPFEVPIPHEHGVRSVRQLPIEVDPPAHTAWRAMTNATFARDAVEAHVEVVANAVDDGLRAGLAAGQLDVIGQLALPTVNHALAAVLGRPAEDARTWLPWGTHVFRASDGASKQANVELDAYLEHVVDEAMSGDGGGFFGALATASFEGRRLTRDEMLGFGNLLFAGGRDTVIGAIAAGFVVLADAPAALEWINADAANARTAVDEVLRIISPLPYIGRHATTSTEAGGCPIPLGGLLALGFAAANRDPAAFDDAQDCVLDRRPNRHIAFGYGPHTCLGAHLARMEVRVALERTAALVADVRLVEPPRPRHLDVGGHPVMAGFERVVVALQPRDET